MRLAPPTIHEQSVPTDLIAKRAVKFTRISGFFGTRERPDEESHAGYRPQKLADEWHGHRLGLPIRKIIWTSSDDRARSIDPRSRCRYATDVTNSLRAGSFVALERPDRIPERPPEMVQRFHAGSAKHGFFCF